MQYKLYHSNNYYTDIKKITVGYRLCNWYKICNNVQYNSTINIGVAGK